MKGIKRKQIVVLLLVAVVIAAGILQYNYNNNHPVSDVSGEGFDGAAHVDGQASEHADVAAAGEDGGPSLEANSFFAQARLDRDIEYSKNTSYLKQLSTDASAEAAIQKQAYDQFVSILEESEVRTRIESMIKEKSFEDVFVAIGKDGSVDVVVKTPSLTQSQVAQIADIVSRQADVALTMIHVRPLY